MRNLFLCLTLLVSSGVYAEEIYHFQNIQQEAHFKNLTSQLRCLVCQNQNIAESNAPLANDLRAQIYTKLQNQQSDQQIVDYLVARYGDFILYNPPLNFATWGLWFGPLTLLIAGLTYLLCYLRKHSNGNTI